MKKFDEEKAKFLIENEYGDDITLTEYEYSCLTEEDSEGFEPDGINYRRVRIPDVSDDKLAQIVQIENNNQLREIKKYSKISAYCLVFFVVISVISMISVIILACNVAALMSELSLSL